LKTPDKFLAGTLILSQLFLSVEASQDKTYKFDFGPTESESVKGYKKLSEKSDYTVKSGYGLLNKGASPVIYNESILLDNIETDGIILILIYNSGSIYLLVNTG